MSQPPHSRAAARVRSVRIARRDTHTMAANAISAAGSSQLIWPPNSEANSRVMPVDPPKAEPPPPRPPAPPPPIEPVSLPSSRPRPL